MKKLIIILTAILFSSCELKESERWKNRQTSVLELRQLVNKIEQLRVNINNKLVKPDLKIHYKGSKETNSYVVNDTYNIEFYVINCPEKYLPENLLPIKL
jgi:hypothetical protein